MTVPGQIASRLLVTTMLAGCAASQIAAPAPTPPPTRSIATAPTHAPGPAATPPSTVPPTTPPEMPPGLASPPVSGSAPSVTAPPSAPARPTTTPGATPPATSAPSPAAPPRVLSTAVDEQRIRRDAQSRIDGTERLMRDIDRTKLITQQEESYQTIQSFLGKAKEALAAQDLQRAYTLADKAYLLAGELMKATR